MRLPTARLSARRRSPLAGLVVLMLGLVLTGGIYAALSPATAQTGQADQATVAKGRTLFLVGCATCHGKNGEGVITTAGTQWGPPLAGVGAAAVDFQVGTGRMPLARPGMQAASKKIVYNDQEIRQLGAYVASLAPGPAVPDRAAYDTSETTTEERVRGGQLFLTNCTACHNYAGSGGALPMGKYAPPLKGTSNKHIYEAMITGPQQMPVFSDQVLEPQEKRDIISYVKGIEAAPQYGGSNLSSLGPVSEGVIAWLIGIGACVAIAVWIASHTTRSQKGTGS